MRLLLLAVVATPLLAFWPTNGQHPDQWEKHVRKACESRRFGIRLAAAKRVAEAGAEAVPAIQAYAKSKGRNALPASLIDAIADSDTTSPETESLLQNWAEDRDFFWRASAMRGLALRAVGLPKGSPDNQAQTAARIALFEKYREDPAWKMRTGARLGLALVAADDDAARAVFALPEADPRARVRLARLYLEHGRTPPLQPLIDALADQRTFMDIPWGPRLGLEASKALNAWLGADFPKLVGGDYAKSIAAILAAAKKKSGQELTVPPTKTDPAVEAIGGIELASCKFGDQFVQWLADGTLKFGIDGGRTAKLPSEPWQKLLQQQTALALKKNSGVVVCDKMQVVLIDPKTRVNIAPESLPAEATEWLKRLVLTLEEANEAGLATDLRRGLGQFERR